MSVSIEQVRNVLGDSLQLGNRVAGFSLDTPLVGNLTELDSMAIITVITDLGEKFNIVGEDDDDLSSAFSTMASLINYIESKMLSM